MKRKKSDEFIATNVERRAIARGHREWERRMADPIERAKIDDTLAMAREWEAEALRLTKPNYALDVATAADVG